MKVLLTGATGTIASSLLPRLRAKGHTVLGLTRSARGVRQLHAAGAAVIQVDLLDADALLTALRGQRADAVIHQATAIDGVPWRHRDLYATNALRDHGTANLLRAAALVDARRFVTQSFLLGYGYSDHGDERLTEDQPFAEPTGRHAFDRHMNAMRSNERQVLDTPGIDGVALRYGMFYGPEPATRRLAMMAQRRRLPVPRPSGTTSLIHIHDAASATVAALEHGRDGQAYNITDDEPVSFADYIAAIADRSGAPEPPTIPGHLLRPLPYMHALMVATRISLSNDKARRGLDWSPMFPSYREGLNSLGTELSSEH